MRSSSRLLTPFELLLRCLDAGSPRRGSAAPWRAGSKSCSKRSISPRATWPYTGQHLLHVGLAEGGAGLAQVFGVGAQHHHLAPGEPGAQHQLVESVAFQRLRRPGTPCRALRRSAGPPSARSTGDWSAVSTLSTCRATAPRRPTSSRNGASLSTRRPRFSASGRMSDSASGAVGWNSRARSGASSRPGARSSLHAERGGRRGRPAPGRGRPRPGRHRSCRDRPAGNQSRQRRRRRGLRPRPACPGGRCGRRSLHGVAASARARSSSTRSGDGVSLRIELQRVERPGPAPNRC